MSRSTVPRPSVALLYLAAYLVTLLCFVMVWFRWPNLMYLGRDADLSLWLNKVYLDWARPFDVTSMNPMQGMTSLLIAMNPYFNPAVWVFQTDLPEVLKRVVSFVIYFVEVTGSTYALGATLGFSRPFAFVAALWLAFLLFPPFSFVFGLAGWLATWPPYGHALALSNLLLIAFSGIGAPQRASSTFARQLLVNWLLASCVLLLVLMIVLAAPFYNAGMLIGTFLLTGVLFLASSSRAQLLWRTAAGAYVAACCAALHFPAFFAGARAASARFSGAVESSLDLFPSAGSLLCAWGLLCDRLADWPGALTSSHWLQACIVLGAIAAAVRALPPLSRIAAWFAVLWASSLLIWICASFGFIAPPAFAPLYFYLMMYPFWALFSLYAGYVLFDAIDSRLVSKNPLRDHLRISAGLCVVALALLFLFHASPRHLHDWGPLQGRTATPITDYLQREIALRPGDIYRGSVATLLGAPGSPLRQRLLENPERLKHRDFETFLGHALRSTGNTHDLLDLWWLGIPTLSEYGQGLSKGLMFYMSGVLNAAGDARDVNFGLPRLAKLDVLRAMGVHFVITDLELPADNATNRRTVPLHDGIDLHLYELRDPNLAGFSLRKVSGLLSPRELSRRLDANPRLLESEAFAEQSATHELVPVERSQLRFERGGVRVTASSKGQSALLLPLQFSHCFRAVGDNGDHVTVMRANLIHTLLLFSGDLDVRLEWQFSFWRNSGCRLKDAADMAALGLD